MKISATGILFKGGINYIENISSQEVNCINNYYFDCLLWTVRIIPSGLCIITATRYINDKYPDKDFRYSFIEYSSAHGAYFVHFIDEDGKSAALMTSPFSVRFDPLNIPN